MLKFKRTDGTLIKLTENFAKLSQKFCVRRRRRQRVSDPSKLRIDLKFKFLLL